MTASIWVRTLSKAVKDNVFTHSIHTKTYRICSNHKSFIVWNFEKITYRNYCSFLNPSYQQQMMDFQKFRKDALSIFQASVDAVYPPNMIKKCLQISEDGNKLIVDDREYTLNKNVYVVGFGKAVLGMARAVEDLVGQHLVEGAISVPVGSQQLLKSMNKSELCLKDGSKVRVFEGAPNNMPDKAANSAAMFIKKMIEQVDKDDILIVLISGGGSALLPCPEPPISLEDELEMTDILSKHGASIQQLNILRQNIETLKGGGLAELSRPASTVSLILSDVIGDKLDIISSGPTVPRHSSPKQCLHILESLGVQDKIPRSIYSTLQRKVEEEKIKRHAPGTLASQNYVTGCDHVQNVIIGSNTVATEAAFRKAEELNYIPLVLTNTLEGDAKEAAEMFVKLVKFVILGFGDMPANMGKTELAVTELDIVKYGIPKTDIKRVDAAATKSNNSQKGLCIICGGETTVKVTGAGKGGRNQEMALYFAILLDSFVNKSDKKTMSEFHIEFLSAGTDGQDGPTDAAGAVVNKNLVPIAISSKMNPQKFLSDNDSYHLFKALKSDSLIECGLTGTNVMDIQVLLIKYQY